MLAGKIARQSGQIALQMDAERQEIRYDEYLFRARGRELCDCVAQAWRGFEKCGLVQRPISLLCGFGCYNPHGLVRRWHARPMPEYDDSGPHSYRMIRGSFGSTVLSAAVSGA